MAGIRGDGLFFLNGDAARAVHLELFHVLWPRDDNAFRVRSLSEFSPEAVALEFRDSLEARVFLEFGWIDNNTEASL